MHLAFTKSDHECIYMCLHSDYRRENKMLFFMHVIIQSGNRRINLTEQHERSGKLQKLVQTDI